MPKYDESIEVVTFYRASYALAVYAMVVCLCVCLSVTSRSSTKTAKRRMTQTTPYDSPGTLVFSRQIFFSKFDRGHPQRGRQM